MADEPRRSVRATKGQHTKSLDILDQPAGKKRASKKGGRKSTAKEEEVEVIRCVCGARETGEDEGEAWIACDSCGVWQHNVCMGVSPFEEELPDNYLCEECAPEAHQELLAGMKRGEQPWEARRIAHEQELAEQEEAEAEAPRKKGKRGRAKAADKLESPQGYNGKAKSPSTTGLADAKTIKKDPSTRAGSAKRKNRDDSQDMEPIANKTQKIIATPTTPTRQSPVSNLPSAIIELEKSRQGPASLIQKSLVYAIDTAIKSDKLSLQGDETVQAKAERLSLELEDAIYHTHADKATYSKQARSLSFNLKKNQELYNGILRGTLSVNALAVMTSDDMATKELKLETAQMQARADKQAIMITDDAPRMRRTHKGDEMVEQDDFAITSYLHQLAPGQPNPDSNAGKNTRSRESSEGATGSLDEKIVGHNSRSNGKAKGLPNIDTESSNIDTKARQRGRKPSQPNFDINKVFSSVQQSPTSASQHLRRPSTSVAPANGPGVDADVDRLLEDETDSPPYSPTEDSMDPDVVWQGSVFMDQIASYPCTGKHIGGADLTKTYLKLPWNEIVDKELKVAGRIDRDKANEYLCSLRYSLPTDLVLMTLIPTGEAATKASLEIFNYFYGKKRFGVLTNKGFGNVRDTYLVPIPASPAEYPDFIDNLEGHKVPEHRPEHSMLIALVVRPERPHPDAPAASQNPDSSADVSSPMTHHQRQMSLSGAGPAMSPTGAQGGYPATPTPAQPNATQGPMDEAQRQRLAEERRAIDQRDGEAVAARILGSYISAPTVLFLMPQAYQMRPIEWEVVKNIFDGDALAQQDLAHLSQLLEMRMAEQPK